MNYMNEFEKVHFVFRSWRVPAGVDGISLFVLLGVQPVDRSVESG